MRLEEFSREESGVIERELVGIVRLNRIPGLVVLP